MNWSIRVIEVIEHIISSTTFSLLYIVITPTAVPYAANISSHQIIFGLRIIWY